MKFEIYKDAKGEWRWRLRAKNGRIVADSAEGYKKRASVANAVLNLVFFVREGPVSANTWGKVPSVFYKVLK